MLGSTGFPRALTFSNVHKGARFTSDIVDNFCDLICLQTVFGFLKYIAKSSDWLKCGLNVLHFKNSLHLFQNAFVVAASYRNDTSNNGMVLELSILC